MEKIAIIELADSATKLSIYKTQNGRYKLVRHEEDRVSIFKDIAEEKLLRPKTITDVVSILKIYRNVIEDNEVQKIIAVSDKAIASARNQRGFFDEVFNNTGISFSFLNEEDVVKAIYTSVVNSIDNSKGGIIYIGANDTYFIRYNRRTTLGYSSVPYGYENIMEGAEKSFDEMKKLFLAELNAREFKFDVDSPLVGAGIPFINLGRISKKVNHYSLELDNNYEVSASSEKAVMNFVGGLDLEKVKKVKGLVDDRTEVLMSGLAIVSAVYDYFKADQITVTTANTRDGLVAGSISGEIQEKLSDLLASSFYNIYEFEKTELSANLRVANMATILFKQLKVMHKLPRAYVKPLRVAAYMFDSGKHINFEDYEKHGFYAILNSGLCGASQKDLLLGAFICECQLADNFSLSKWMKYKDILTDEDLNAVRKLGVIVRLSAALNSSKSEVVTDVMCDILGDSIIMKLVVNGDPTYEIMQGMKVARDYRKFFKKNLQLI